MLRNKKFLLILLIVQLFAVLAMTPTGFHKRWQMGAAFGLTASAAVTTSLLYAEPKRPDRSNDRDQHN